MRKEAQHAPFQEGKCEPVYTDPRQSPVIIGDKHGVAAVAAGHHMVNRTGILESWLPCHAIDLAETTDPARFLLIREQ